MRQVFYCLALGLFFLISALPGHAQFTTAAQTNGSTLAQMLAGSGVTISNVTLNGAPLGSGTFKNLNDVAHLGLDSGIVLTTGTVTSMVGAQSTTFTVSNNQGRGGDAQLSQAINGTVTKDANILEFDFIPTGDTIRFNYVFASEEYPDYNCSDFNDVFAFFISGPGITGAKNIALVPGTTIPVAINSINNGIPGFGSNLGDCTAMGAGSPFTQYYFDNTGGTAFTYDGFTKVLTAKSAVTPCQVYHLRIGIADAFDANFDSGVFLKAGSLTSDPLTLVGNTPITGGLPYLVEGCNPGTLNVLRSKKLPYAQQVAITVSGSALNGLDITTLPAMVSIPANDSVVTVPLVPVVDNIAEGIENMTICVSNVCANLPSVISDCFTLQIRDYDTLSLLPDDTVRVCGSQVLPVTATGNYSVFQWSPTTGVANPNIGTTTITAVGGLTKYVLTAGIGTCQARDSLTVWVKDLDILDTVDVNCKGAATGSLTLAGGTEWLGPLSYNIDNGPYVSNAVFNGLTAGPHLVSVKDTAGCIDTATVNIVQLYPDLAATAQSISASCTGQNGSLDITGSGGLAPYQYSLENAAYVTSPSFTVGSGMRHFTIKDANGCLYTDSANIAKDAPINFTIATDPAACDGSLDGFLTITATGGTGNYSYSLDNTNFQPGNALHSFSVTNTVYVKDDKGCASQQNISVPYGTDIFVDLGHDTTICEGSSLHFAASSNADSFNWTAVPSLSSTSILDPVASPVTTTTYYITATKSICMAKDTITVAVNAAPVPNAGLDISFCLGRQVLLTGSGGTVYHWHPGSVLSDSTIASPMTQVSSSTMFTLTVTDANGCNSLKADTVMVTIIPALQPFAGADTAVAMNQPLQLNGVNLGSSAITNWSWAPASGLSNPFIANPILTTDHDVVLVLTMATAQGCTGSDTVKISAYKGPEIYVPDAFTPNGDGKNDVLRPIAVGVGSFKYFYVFNRWGQRVFASAMNREGWDGTINGTKQPSGVYVWVVEMVDYSGKTVFKKGTSVLIR